MINPKKETLTNDFTTFQNMRFGKMDKCRNQSIIFLQGKHISVPTSFCAEAGFNALHNNPETRDNWDPYPRAKIGITQIRNLQQTAIKITEWDKSSSDLLVGRVAFFWISVHRPISDWHVILR